MKTMKRLGLLGTVCVAIVLSPAAVSAQGSPAGGTTTTTRVDDNDPDYGWIGLAGLLGLLGLKRNRDNDTTRRDNDVTRR